MASLLGMVAATALGLLLQGAPHASVRVARVPALAMAGDSEATRDSSPSAYEEYLMGRDEAEMSSVEEGYRSFRGIDQEFDGGDSGGGVVGDGNVDLEDQHNSPSIVRGGFGAASVGEGGGNVGRGTVVAATNARQSSAGANYFGRDTGLASKLIEEMDEKDVYHGRMDKVRAQQKENWFNQRAIHESNKQQGQGVVYGASGERTHYIAREQLASDKWRQGEQEGVISQADLASHMQELASKPAARLDGQDWGAVQEESGDLQEVVEMRVGVGKTDFKEIKVKNDYNTFAPYRCDFAAGSHPAFTVTPNAGTMNRRSGEPVEVTVRYTPKDITTEAKTATLVFETEDFKKVWKFIGGT